MLSSSGSVSFTDESSRSITVSESPAFDSSLDLSFPLFRSCISEVLTGPVGGSDWESVM